MQSMITVFTRAAYTVMFFKICCFPQVSFHFDKRHKIIIFFSSLFFQFGLKVQPDDDDPRVPLLAWATCAYTMQCFGNVSTLIYTTGLVVYDCYSDVCNMVANRIEQCCAAYIAHSCQQ